MENLWLEIQELVKTLDSLLYTLSSCENTTECAMLSIPYGKISKIKQFSQMARNYVIALLQKITYDEYIPALLGRANFDP